LRRRQFGRSGSVDADTCRYECADTDAVRALVATAEFRDSYSDAEPLADRNAHRFGNADADCNA
jgi:hypothetical protein